MHFFILVLGIYHWSLFSLCFFEQRDCKRPTTDALQAIAKQSHLESIVTRFATWFTPAVILACILIIVVPIAKGSKDRKKWVNLSLQILVTACPCALVLSTPVTVVAGLAASARQGVLIKVSCSGFIWCCVSSRWLVFPYCEQRFWALPIYQCTWNTPNLSISRISMAYRTGHLQGGQHLEALAKVKTVTLDKTGTLTSGCFQVYCFFSWKQFLTLTAVECICRSDTW